MLQCFSTKSDSDVELSKMPIFFRKFTLSGIRAVRSISSDPQHLPTISRKLPPFPRGKHFSWEKPCRPWYASQIQSFSCTRASQTSAIVCGTWAGFLLFPAAFAAVRARFLGGMANKGRPFLKTSLTQNLAAIRILLNIFSCSGSQFMFVKIW